MRHDLEASIPYLVARAGIRMGQAFSVELRRFGLTLNEWRVLATLRQHPQQRLGEVAGHTSVDASTLSRCIDAMVQRGLVSRERSADDARAVALSLTADGAALADRVIPVAQTYERVGLAGIDAAQAALLRELLRRIYDNIERLERPE